MRLYKELFRSAAFNLGFWLSAAIFLILNLIPNGPISYFGIHLDVETGFPFVNHVSNHYGAYFSNYGLIADALIGVMFCFAVGLLFKYVSSKWNR